MTRAAFVIDHPALRAGESARASGVPYFECPLRATDMEASSAGVTAERMRRQRLLWQFGWNAEDLRRRQGPAQC